MTFYPDYDLDYDLDIFQDDGDLDLTGIHNGMDLNLANITATSWEAVEASKPFQLAKQLHEAIQDAQPFCVAESPKWSSWLDQIWRSSQSVLLNYAEGHGRLRGHFTNSMLVARGEAYEVAAALSIGPKHIADPLKPIVLELFAAINHRLREAV